MERIEIIKYLVLNNNINNLKNDAYLLFRYIEDFSLNNPDKFNDLIDKKIIKATQAALLQVSKSYTTQSLMIEAITLFIRQFDDLYSANN